jgi:hypothetical protein
MSTKEKLPPLNDRQLRLWGIPLSVIVIMLGQMPFFYPGDWDYFWKATTIGIIFTGTMWEIGRQIILYGRRRFPGLPQTRKRVCWIFFWVMVQYTIGQAVLTQVYFSTGLNIDKSLSFVETWLLYLGTSALFIILIIGFYETIYFFHQYKNALQKAEHLKKQHSQQRLDALKNRVNPHFLFNSLTTLSALIGEEPRRAEVFVDELAKVYRYLLRAGRQYTATLQEEYHFARSYAFLLSNRFEPGAFSLDLPQSTPVDTASEPEADDKPDSGPMLPTLCLQHALDYLVRTQHTPLHLVIRTAAQGLTIRCRHQPKALSFDASHYDWQQMETNGTSLDVGDGQMTINIPFIDRSVGETHAALT